MSANCRTLIYGLVLLASASSLRGEVTYRSHEPMRPLPTAAKLTLADGPRRFVDAAKGNDAAVGTEQAPWRTLAHSLRQLKPGDTLYLRAGTFYEKPYLTRSGTAEAPITISAYPGELPVIDGSLREFMDDPASSWEPYPSGAEGEYVSTKSYLGVDDRQAPDQFLPGSWEPLWGIEEERPLALGHFADSMVPLHGYRIVEDLRSKNELWLGGKKEMRDTGLYGGPGIWFNRDTGRVHIRLAHHRLEGLGNRAYRGETDPRKLPLVVALGFGRDVFRITGIKHVRVQGLVLRGATGSPLVHVYGSNHIDLDHLHLYGGFPALLVNASQDVRATHSAFRGLAAPWTSRAHMKYRGTGSYQILLRNNQPTNENIELAWCEFTDDHDFAFLRHVRNLQFHHNFVDNFNDDGLECGPKLRDHTLYIHQNRIGACLIPLTQHEIEKDESPLDHDSACGVFLCRNVFDLRAGTFKSPPSTPDPSGAYLHEEGHLAGDHGGPIWPVYHYYHNTALRRTPVFRNYFLFGMGVMGVRNSERDVFNNIFAQVEGLPSASFAGVTQASNLKEGANLIWGVKEGPTFTGDTFAKFRASPMFKESQKFYVAGWTTHDRLADPKFVRFTADGEATDLRLQPTSPAIDAGQTLPTEWLDPLREKDQGQPDIGAIPAGVEPWAIGVDGRLSIFGGAAQTQ